MHPVINLKNETKLDREFNPWLALPTRNFIEVDSFVKALIDKKDEVLPLVFYLEFGLESLY